MNYLYKYIIKIILFLYFIIFISFIKHFHSTGSLPICDLSQIKCVHQNKNNFQGSQPRLNTTKDSITIESNTCGCYPDCEMIQYPSEISSGELDRQYSFNSLGFL